MRCSVVPLFLGHLVAVMAAGLLSKNDRIPRQTGAIEDDVYGVDVGFSPAPTAGPALWGRAPDLRVRSLKPDTCGIATLPHSTFAIVCPRDLACQTSGEYMACGTQPVTKCFDGTASQCQPGSPNLGAGTRCCTASTSGWRPWCVTYYKDASRNDWRYYLNCGRSRHEGSTSIQLIPATDEPAYFSSTTLTASDPEPAPTETTPTPEPSSSSGSNTGAIVGGVVGGVAVVAIAVCVVVWLVLRRRRGAKEQGGTPLTQSPEQKPYGSQPYPLSVSPQHQYTGHQNQQYAYHAVAPAVPPQQPIHEVAGDTSINNRNDRAELGP
ncbi:hypothetical protein CPLU01_01577 [Colletotrichum plurivorum]|uniref:Uncharacterized protein n=1 Tax=Colletotrichum plurivorum TaxID=2175906 RepID=A0A8H6NNQ8_9PEZI|nr:hypothetical protein CPLU01_01577 [Colletotrichum plurivorum]